MDKINCQLRRFRINRINIEIEPFSADTEIQLICNEKTGCREPVKSDDLTGLLEANIHIYTEEDETFQIDISANAIFSFDRKPEDFNRVMQEQCYPLMQERIYSAIREITANMGIFPLDLSKKDKNAGRD